MHLDDFGKTEGAAGVIDLALCERGLGGGWRGFTSVGVRGSVLEDSKLWLGNWLVTDIGVGWKDRSHIPVPIAEGYRQTYLVTGHDKREDGPDRPGQPNIGCTIGGYWGEPLNRCAMRHVGDVSEYQRPPDRLSSTEHIAVRMIDNEKQRIRDSLTCFDSRMLDGSGVIPQAESSPLQLTVGKQH